MRRVWAPGMAIGLWLVGSACGSDEVSLACVVLDGSQQVHACYALVDSEQYFECTDLGGNIAVPKDHQISTVDSCPSAGFTGKCEGISLRGDRATYFSYSVPSADHSRRPG